MSPRLTKFRNTEKRLYIEGRRIEFRDGKKWLQGVVARKWTTDPTGAEYVMVTSKDVSTLNVNNGETVKAYPGSIRQLNW